MVFAVHRRVALLVVYVGLSDFFLGAARAAVRFDLQQAPFGLAVTTIGNNYQSTFGTLDALGINPGATGLSRITPNTGTLYYSAYQIFLHANALPAGRHGTVTAYVSTNFAHPLALTVYSCSSASACNTFAAFAPMSTAAATATTVIPAPGLLNGQTATAAIAVWVPDNNGASAFSGTDNVIVTVTLTQVESGATVETLQWRFNLAPAGATLQRAVRLRLGTNAGGASIVATGGTPDYTLNFGNVNGLGIGPAPGFTATSVAGGFVYATPYDLSPAFSDITSTTATITVYVSTDFAHPTVLQLRDATSTAGPFTAISKNVAAPTQITTAAADRSTITRVLGLFVSNVSGAGSYRGADNATLTFTLAVP